jgi:hypothetical protein
VGTNQMSEIEIVGDGASLLSSPRPSTKTIATKEFQLFQNYPNPLNPSTTIKIYNILGQEVETLIEGNIPAGKHELRWSADYLSNGVYIDKMQTIDYSAARKIFLQK